jgi:hypothetical protein
MEVEEDKSIDFKRIQRQVDQLKIKVKRKLSPEIQIGQSKSRRPKSNFLKSIFYQVELVQERSKLKVEVEENLNTIQVQDEARWVD